MARSSLREALGAAATALITAHLIATTLFNTPDSFNLDLRRYVGGWTIPGWRFFAPNPGTQNVHLLIRTNPSVDRPCAGEWRDITPKIPHRPWNVLINPKSRGPKALFDAMQQLSVMKVNYSQFDWIVDSTAYKLISDAARGALWERDAARFQFLLVNYFPAASPQERVQPLLVSEWLNASTGADA